MQNQTKILLIDDHQITRSLLRSLLRDGGYALCREASDALTGVKLAKHFEPDLICLDIEMPGMSGLEALDALREAAPHAAVLMVTAHSDRDTVVACINAGAHGYIIKPFNAVTVLHAVETTLSRRRADNA